MAAIFASDLIWDLTHGCVFSVDSNVVNTVW